jgi:hypothetical protein
VAWAFQGTTCFFQVSKRGDRRSNDLFLDHTGTHPQSATTGRRAGRGKYLQAPREGPGVEPPSKRRVANHNNPPPG